MRREWGTIVLTFFLLVLVAWWIDDFKNNLERHHDISNPIEEIEVKRREALTIERMMIQQCPSKKGHAMIFITCYKEIKAKMLRSDI